MPEKSMLNIGVVGLGQRWRERYRPSLLALRDYFHIGAVTGQVQDEVRRESQALRCSAAGGIVQLLAEPGLDAVLLADEQWHGLWPVQQALASGKPIFSGVMPGETHQLEPLMGAGQSGLIMLDMPWRLSPALDCLGDLCRTELGFPRILHFLIEENDGHTGDSPGKLDFVPYFDMCALLCEADPVRMQTTRTADGSVRTLLIEFPQGRTAQLTHCLSPRKKRRCQIHVICDKGNATAHLPGHVTWSSGAGKWSRRLPSPRNLRRGMLLHFHRAVLQGRMESAHLAAARRLTRWQQVLRQSQEKTAGDIRA